MMSERDLCDALTREARVHVEDVQGGVAIVAKPRAGNAISSVRDRAQQIERRAGQSPGSSIGASCELFAIGRTGATISIAEAPDSVRLLITTSEPGQVQIIRKQVREFVNTTAGKSGGQGTRGQGGSRGQGSGLQQGGGSDTQGGGSGSGTQGGGSGSGTQGGGSSQSSGSGSGQ
jgi:hypothetical protein